MPIVRVSDISGSLSNDLSVFTPTPGADFSDGKWYDPAKGYGFLVPDDGSPDIFCRAPCLAAAGLATLLANARVECETVRVERGLEVSRILAVDFSTASPRTASFARVPGNGRTTAEPGIGRAVPAEAGPGRRITALVKWFMPMKVTASWSRGLLSMTAQSAPIRCIQLVRR